MSIRKRIRKFLDTLENEHHQDVLRALEDRADQRLARDLFERDMHENPLVDIIELGELRTQGIITLFPVCSRKRILSVHETLGSATTEARHKHGEPLVVRKIEYRLEDISSC